MEQDDFLGGGGGDGAGTTGNDASLPVKVGGSFPAGSGKGGQDAVAETPAAVGSLGSTKQAAQGGGGGTSGVRVAPHGQKNDCNELPEKDETAAITEFDDVELDAVGVAETASARAETTAGSGSPSTTSGGKAGVPVKPTSPGKRAASATAAAVPTGASLNDELSQLEELERELGIMEVVGDSAGTSTGSETGGSGGAGSVGAVAEAGKDDDNFDMDNLDELEGYLESLAK